MTLELVFMPAARLEVIEAQNWYEGKRRGLGVTFRAEVDNQVALIGANPQRFPEIHADIRRARLRRFPYGLFFRPLDDAIYVVACFHSGRNPLIWQRRV